MEKNYTPLLELATNQLLKKFGAGNHKPGSGSAAAFLGLLASHLVITVSTLSRDRPAYARYRSDFEAHILRLESNIIPRLEVLFQKDAQVFDQVYTARMERDAEKDYRLRPQKILAATDAMIPATEVPVEIAEWCIEIARLACFNFEFGFKSAKGDSGVALTTAISGITGCLSIIDLNLKSFRINEWTELIWDKRNKLSDALENLEKQKVRLFAAYSSEVTQYRKLHRELHDVLSEKRTGRNLNALNIETRVSKLQNIIWDHRNLLYPSSVLHDDDPFRFLKVLDPIRVLKTLGYEVFSDNPLGTTRVNDELFEVAGVIDNQNLQVHLSSEFAPETQRFTAAHELGHALLHNHEVMHRDRPIDGPRRGNDRKIDVTERQADLFAATFLMPMKQVIDVFQLYFETDKVVINEASRVGFNLRTVDELRRKCPNRRALSRLLATASFYNYQPLIPLHNRFLVSVETMAIRLEELELV